MARGRGEARLYRLLSLPLSKPQELWLKCHAISTSAGRSNALPGETIGSTQATTPTSSFQETPCALLFSPPPRLSHYRQWATPNPCGRPDRQTPVSISEARVA